MAKKPVPKKSAVQKASVANNRPFVGLLVLVAVVGVGTLGYVLTRPTARALTVDPAIPAGTAEGYLIGNANAPVQVLEFGDFECPGCGAFANVTEPDIRERLIKTGIVGFRFMDFPLPMHKNTWTAHIAAACAGEQGRFWEMHDQIFAGQNEWNGPATTNPVKVLKRYAGMIALDVGKWETCVSTQAPTARVKANVAEGERRRVGGTPTFIIGNKMLPSDLLPSYDTFKAYVDSALAALPKTAAPATPVAGKKSAGKPGT